MEGSTGIVATSDTPGVGRPNILYIHSHDTGRYVSPYGHAVDTPNYQRLAEEGILFRQAFTSAPTCSPSRAGLLTGQSPHSAGMLGLAHRGFRLHEPGQQLATILRDNGYATTLAGVQHVHSGDAPALGYQNTRGGEERDYRTVAANAVAALRNHASSGTDAPFFLDAGFVETHRPYPEVDEADSRYVQPPPHLPNTPQTRLDMARYGASVRDLDTGLGTVLDALDETGLAANTLVICTTDHGLAFPGMKCNLTDTGTGVLLIVRGPGGFAGGQVCDSLISQIDIYPTVCEVLGIERPAWLQGTSIMPVVREEAEEVNDAIYAEVTYHAAYEPQRAIRTREWLYVERFGERDLPVLPNCDDGESRDFLLGQGWGERRVDRAQLYDNTFDPMQRRNLASDDAYASVAADLRSRLRDWMERTGDPLLDGPVPLPVGASTNDPVSRSFLDDLIVARPDGTLERVPNPRINA
jgi:arylsulfatase A-like enzyme